MHSRSRPSPGATWALLALLVATPCSPAGAQDRAAAAPPSSASRITVAWTEAPIHDVLLAFAAYSGKSIVPAASVTGTVTANINDQPWDVALRTILSTRGLVAVEDEYGIIRVETLASLDERERIEPLVTRAYRISFVDAEEIRATLAPLLSSRGSVSVSPSTNTVVVSDIPRIHRAIAGILRAP